MWLALLHLADFLHNDLFPQSAIDNTIVTRKGKLNSKFKGWKFGNLEVTLLSDDVVQQ
jgi:hypothetical protein